MSEVFAAHGTRKKAVSNAFVKSGTGKITVKCSFPARKVRSLNRKNNQKGHKAETLQLKKIHQINEYFQSLKGVNPEAFMNEVLEKANLLGKIDVTITCKGGGLRRQLEAARLALAKALVASDASLRALISSYLHTDDRKVERQKVGKKGARASNQFSKR